ncbi:MAG: hypothetical protein D6731_15830 [Planctomycetota bacterium]|nr:MAG: hypothetical protein D6731_15830 [Planctomycetota bacterium]
MNRSAIVSLALAVSAAPAAAERFHLRSGEVLDGAYVGESRGRVSLLTSAGPREVPREAVARIDWTHTPPASLRARARRARARLLARDAREARRLLRSFARARNDSERARRYRRLAALEPEALRATLDAALRGRDPATRLLAVRLLAASGSPQALGAVVRAALTDPDPEFARAAHWAACRANPDLARSFYAEVAAGPARTARRLRAIACLRELKDHGSVACLVRVLERAQAQLRAAQTRDVLPRASLPLRSRRPVGGAVPAERSESPRAEVRANNAQSAVAALRRVVAAAREALEALTGQGLGDDPTAWRRWWAERKASPRPGKAVEGAAPAPAEKSSPPGRPATSARR